MSNIRVQMFDNVRYFLSIEMFDFKKGTNSANTSNYFTIMVVISSFSAAPPMIISISSDEITWQYPNVLKFGSFHMFRLNSGIMNRYIFFIYAIFLFPIIGTD